MRNLKKLLAVVLTVVMIASMMVPALAANTYEAEALQLQAIKVFAGGPEDLKLDESVTRIQGLTFAIRSAGKDADALAMTAAEVDAILADWTDAASIPAWGRAYAAYAIKNNITVGLSATSKIFGAMQIISGRSLLVFIMKAGMGYADVTTANVIEASVTAGILTAGQAATFGAKEALVRDDAAGILFGAFATGVNADGSSLIDAYIASGATTAADAAAAGFVSSAALAVESITANTAKSFLVKFNKAVTDDDKITFAVKRLTTAVTVTATWNEAKTEATLSTASSLAESAYTVSVLADAAEIAKESISITAQKVAKIEFVSNSVAVKVADNIGYVSFKVYDQYDNDITATAKANALSVQVGLGTATIKNGLLTITGANPALVTVTSLSVVLFDASAGVTATTSLPISTTVGTLTSFELGSADDIKLVEGDTTSVFYIPYIAKDMSGNETKSYELVTGGLIDADPATANVVDLIGSLGQDVSVKVVKDPADSKKAAIAVQFVQSTGYFMDMPLTITAMTYGGGSSSVSTTVAKARAIASLILLAPEGTVGIGETPEIPFEAYDVNGNRLTSTTYINYATVTPTNFKIVEKSDGSAKFEMLATATAAKGMVNLNATITGGKVSNILTINVQDKAVPTSIGFASSGIVTAMEQKAVQKIEVGPDLIVYDQYDRVMSDDDIAKYMETADDDLADNKIHYVTATVAGDALLDAGNVELVGAAAYEMVNGADFYLKAKNVPGSSATITFTLYQDIAGATDKVLDTASVAISVVATEDIVDYTINTSDKAIYTINDDATVTDQEKEYKFGAEVFGKTDAGTKVLLAGTPIANATISNATDFTLVGGGAAAAYNGIVVVANELANDKTAAETDLVVTVVHNAKVKPLKVAIASSTTAPVATEIKLDGATSAGVAEITFADTAGNATFTLDRWDLAGVKSTNDHFYIVDSYGTKGMNFAQYQISKVIDYDDNATPADTSDDIYTTITDKTTIDTYATIDGVGLLTVKDAVAADGDKIYVTAITNNGLSATMIVELK